MSASRLAFLGIVGCCLLGSCGGQPPYWSHPVNVSGNTYGLAGGVAIVDDVDHRVVFLTGASDQTLAAQSITIGHNFTSAATSVDGSTLFVLSSGDPPGQTSSDQPPSLTVIQVNPSTFTASPKAYTMADPLSNLAIDPLGTYAVAYQGSGASTSFAQNPNEIVIFDLTKDYAPQPTGSSTTPPNPVSRSIRSFGGTPQQLTFSPSLNLPANASTASVRATARRLLLIETNLDVSVVDLTHAFDPPVAPATTFGRPEITVQLTSGTDTASVAPTGLVVDPNPDDGRIAFFTTTDTNVYTLQLLPSAGTPNDFNPQINLTDVGGGPSDIQFVRTDQGLRVAALVPSTSSAVLIEPDTSVTTQVALASAFSSMSLVTNVVSGTSSSTDVALLWGSTATGVASGVALWTLGTTVGQPYRSIEVLQIAAPIQAVLDVPAPNDNLKVLATQPGQGSGDFYILDLVQRTANPIHTTTSPLLTIAPDGMRMWAYDQSTDLALIDFTTLNPVPLTTDTPISVVYDIANAGGGRSLVALDAEGTFGATVFNALSPQATSPQTTPRRDVALLLEGP
ncbi:MAG: hypothetical protein ACLP1X_33555 [Polyangiaceae bacterium]|jgi:hypothetical protein